MFSRHIRSLTIAAAAIASLSSASAQQFNTIPSGTVIGRTAVGAGPAQAVPIQQLFSSLLTGPLSVPGVNTTSVIYRGSTSGQATVAAQLVAGTPSILWPNTSGTVATNATSPIVLDATSGNVSCPSCSPPAWSNARLAVSSAYTAAFADCGSTLALGGSKFFTLTLNLAASYATTCAFYIVNEDTTRGKMLAINDYSNFVLWPRQTAIVYNQNNAWQVSKPGRWKLTGPVTMYADPVFGDDANDGLATGTTAFKTLTGAWTNICTNIDFSGQTVTLQLADGTYFSGLNSTIGPMNAPYLGFVINGNATTPDSVLLSTGASDSFRWFETGSPISVWIKNLKMTTTGGDAVRVLGAGNYVRVSNVNFGSVGGGVHMRAFNAAEIDAFSDSYKITGGGAAHYNVNGLGVIGVQSQTINISGNPTFAAAFGLADGGQILVQGDTYSVTGSVTGTRYIVRNLGLIDSAGAGAAYLPGSIAGATFTGGVYN